SRDARPGAGRSARRDACRRIGRGRECRAGNVRASNREGRRYRPVAPIHELHEFRGSTVAAGDSKIAESLVAPGTVEGMFHDGEQFDVRIAEVFDVRYELLAQFAVAQPSIVVFGHAAPGAGMDFVDGDW